jgi:hypothetical protein
METPVRLAVALVTAVLILGLLIWARGVEHHRGDDVGSLGPSSSAAAGPSPGENHG